jgi:TPR repeat protein
MYKTGQGVRQSNSKAKELYGKACDNGSAKGCSNYAAMNK